jgi:hypothetical protein
LYLNNFQLAFPILDLNTQGLGLFFKLNVGNYKLLLEFLIGLLQTCYNLIMLHVILLHLVVVPCHMFMLTLESFKSLWIFQLNWLNSMYYCCKFSIFPTTCFAYFNLLDMFWFWYCTLINYHLTMIISLSWFFKVCCIVSNFRLQVYRWLLISYKFSLVCSCSILRLVSPSNVLDHVVAYWIACSKHINMLQKKL